MATRQMNIRVPEPERTNWARAAARAGLDLSAWIRRTCNQAAAVPTPGPVAHFDVDTDGQVTQNVEVR